MQIQKRMANLLKGIWNGTLTNWEFVKKNNQILYTLTANV